MRLTSSIPAECVAKNMHVCNALYSENRPRQGYIYIYIYQYIYISIYIYIYYINGVVLWSHVPNANVSHFFFAVQAKVHGLPC